MGYCRTRFIIFTLFLILTYSEAVLFAAGLISLFFVYE